VLKPAGTELRADLYAIPGVQLHRADRALHVWSEAPLAVLGSAIVGAELARTRHIVNMHVHKDYDGRAPGADLTALARAWGIVEPFVGLMTAARPDQAQVAIEEGAGATVAAIVTVGLSHPVAAGVTEAMHLRAGTINIILVVDAQLTQAARVNAVITATEAKALALAEAGVRAPHGGLASGTGTDAVVVASTERGPSFEYAGPITPIGAMMARAVRRTMQQAMAR
jgi:adenosylcobinamide amidohydrolase